MQFCVYSTCGRDVNSAMSRHERRHFVIYVSLDLSRIVETRNPLKSDVTVEFSVTFIYKIGHLQ